MTREPLDKNVRIALVNRAFSPAAPVDDRALFADRGEQMDVCMSALYQRGLHVALYGERGVGKTSLAIVLPQIIQGAAIPDLSAVRINCDSRDTYATLWRKVFRALGRPLTPQEEAELEPDLVRLLLDRGNGRLLVVIDELDRMTDDEGLTLLADTIKALSDQSVHTTIMLVGVAESLVMLVGEHASIVRSLVQVHMPRMTRGELRAAIDQGMQRAMMPIEEEAARRIVLLSEGLPHYAHLLAQAAAMRAVVDDRHVTGVTLADVEASMEKAVDRHSLRDDYQRAVSSPQPSSQFENVLLACAFANRDEFGYFRPADLRRPLSLLTGKTVDIPNYQNHLAELAGEKRGRPLQRTGEQRNFRYRFRDPLLQPFTKIHALAKKKISEDMRRRLEGMREGLTTEPDPPSGQGQLF